MKPWLLATAFAGLLVAQTAEAACTNTNEAAFNAVADRTLNSVKTGDAKALLKTFSRDGVSFGVDTSVTPYALLEAQFVSHKGSYYCRLFACGGKTGDLKDLFEVGKETRQIQIEHGETSGTVTVSHGANTSDLELDYVLNPRCEWRLVAIVYL